MWNVLFLVLSSAMTSTPNTSAAVPRPHGNGLEIGLSDADVVKRLGPPSQVDGAHGYLQYTYSGTLCDNDYSCFVGFDEQGKVKNFNSFRWVYVSH